jgi:hypothetical protein
VAADVVERVLHRPLALDAHVVGRHQPPDAALRVAQKRDGDGALAGREEREHLPGDGGGQLFQQLGAVVRRHVVEDARHVRLRHRLEELLLHFEVEVLEHVRGELAREDAEDDDLLVGLQLGDEAREVGRRPAGQLAPEREELALADHPLDVWL